MYNRMFVRELSGEERQSLEVGLKSRDAFLLRRSQVLLGSSRGEPVRQIAPAVGCCRQTVRNVIASFNQRGLDSLSQGSTRPKTAMAELDEAKREKLREILHQSPRSFGKSRSTWTLELAAQVAHEKGLTQGVVSSETIRRAVMRLGGGWKRAKKWITRPDPLYALKKKRRDRLIRLAAVHQEWVLGFGDEVWWSRLALPSMHAWTAGVSEAPLRLVEQSSGKDDPDPKALACYGLLRRDTGEMVLRFVDGRPVSHVTVQFLAWVCADLAAEGKKALLLAWDNASWPISREVRSWVKAHNRRVRSEGGVRIVVCQLPVKSPWLNPIEPKWAHGKRAVVEPERKLAAEELKQRICDHYRCPKLQPLEQKVA